MSGRNYFLTLVLVTILGILTFYASVKGIFDFIGLTFFGVLLMFIPCLIGIFFMKALRLNTASVFFISLLPIISLVFIYVVSEAVPVGFNDVHAHIIAHGEIFDHEGKLSFIDRIALNFVGMYVIAELLILTSGLGILDVANYVPPLILLLSAAMVFLLTKRIFEEKVALLSMLLYGSCIAVIVFGQEFRTQTFAVLMIYILVYFLLVLTFNRTKDPNRGPIVLCSILLLASIVITGFTPSVYLIVILVTFAVLALIIRLANGGTWNSQEFLRPIAFTILSVVFLFSYILYISDGFAGFIDTFRGLIIDMMAADIGEGYGFGGVVYGTFIEIQTNLLRMLFFIGLIALVYLVIKRREWEKLHFVSVFSSLLAFPILSGFLGVGLSVGRTYAVSFVVIGSIIAWTLLNIKLYREPLHSVFFKTKRAAERSKGIIVVVVILLFILSSVFSLPEYIIGNTYPIRGEEPIDGVSYWNSDHPQYSVAGFISVNSENQSIDSFMLIQNWFYRLTSNNNSDPTSEKLLILHERFRGEQYTHRDLLPPMNSFESNDRIYSNIDYLILKGINS